MAEVTENFTLCRIASLFSAPEDIDCIDDKRARSRRDVKKKRKREKEKEREREREREREKEKERENPIV